MLTGDFAFLYPFMTVAVILIGVLIVLRMTEKPSRQEQPHLPFDETHRGR